LHNGQRIPGPERSRPSSSRTTSRSSGSRRVGTLQQYPTPQPTGWSSRETAETARSRAGPPRRADVKRALGAGRRPRRGRGEPKTAASLARPIGPRARGRLVSANIGRRAGLLMRVRGAESRLRRLVRAPAPTRRAHVERARGAGRRARRGRDETKPRPRLADARPARRRSWGVASAVRQTRLRQRQRRWPQSPRATFTKRAASERGGSSGVMGDTR
jgi:hypothetical protein